MGVQLYLQCSEHLSRTPQDKYFHVRCKHPLTCETTAADHNGSGLITEMTGITGPTLALGCQVVCVTISAVTTGLRQISSHWAEVSLRTDELSRGRGASWAVPSSITVGYWGHKTTAVTELSCSAWDRLRGT